MSPGDEVGNPEVIGVFGEGGDEVGPGVFAVCLEGDERLDEALEFFGGDFEITIAEGVAEVAEVTGDHGSEEFEGGGDEAVGVEG